MEEKFLQCPYCWEEISILVEEAMEGEWIEDCEVCCNPIRFELHWREGRLALFRYEKAQ